MSTRTHAVDYYVINGAVWCCDVRSDGRRQIVDLMRPRDFVVSTVISEITKNFQCSNEHLADRTSRAFSCCSHRRVKCPS